MLIRLLLIGLIGVTGLAVRIGRLAPMAGRRATSADCAILSGGAWCYQSGPPRLLDLRSGRVAPWPIEAEGRFLMGSVSPWRDDRGFRQAVGLLLSPAGNAEGPALARIELPSGRMLDILPIAIAPGSPPCWEPGSGSQLFFAGTDEKLYRVDFDEESARTVPRVTRLLWRARGIDPSRCLLSWPTLVDAGVQGRFLIVTLDAKGAGVEWTEDEGCQLWWLRLDRSGGTVVDAGPLATGPGVGWSDESHAAVMSRPDGGMTLAFLAKGDHLLPDLHVAPLRFDPISGHPSFKPVEARRLAEGCRKWAPSFSPDGLQVYVARGLESTPRIDRLALDDRGERSADPTMAGLSRVAPSSSRSTGTPDGGGWPSPFERWLRAIRGDWPIPSVGRE